MSRDRFTHRLGRRSRRDVLRLAATGLLAAAALPMQIRSARATPEDVEAILSERYGDRSFSEARIDLDLPEIAENGNTVPVAVAVDSPMTTDDYVKSVTIFAEGNPLPEVAMFHFTPRSGIAQAATRMRLAGTQNVVAVAEMSDGSLYLARKEVKVTIGGCGG